MPVDTLDRPSSSPRAAPVCNHCPRRMVSELDQRHNGNWFRQCSNCRASARRYNKRQRAETNPTDQESPGPVRQRVSPGRDLDARRDRRRRDRTDPTDLGLPLADPYDSQESPGHARQPPAPDHNLDEPDPPMDSMPNTDTEDPRASPECSRCRRRLESRDDRMAGGNWYKMCNRCRSYSREYQRRRSERRRNVTNPANPTDPGLG
jgi:hypothetical protein